jgi:hypothetical protein
MEYKIHNDDEFFRYRNKLTARFPLFSELEIRPEVAVEPFYDFKADELNKNRAYASLGLTIIDGVKLKADYILESNKKQDEWKHIDVFELTLSYVL